jgi:hypothetical protein
MYGNDPAHTSFKSGSISMHTSMSLLHASLPLMPSAQRDEAKESPKVPKSGLNEVAGERVEDIWLVLRCV